MFSTTDTIVAVATPPGRGGIGVVRVSGTRAAEIARRLTLEAAELEPRRATLRSIRAGAAVVDRAILTLFVAPHSYTGEDVLEISAHGSPMLLREIVRAAIDAGARQAEPGEFTFRAYLGGRVDLVQAEAVRDLVDAVTPLQARAAFDQLQGTLTARIAEVDRALFDVAARLEASLDFPEEGYHFIDADSAAAELAQIIGRIDGLLSDAERGRLIREGAQVAIAGRPNVGKSSLFNQLAGVGRAIVTEIPGTTRDLLTETIDIDGIPLTVVDTAGLRAEGSDEVEREGIERARAAMRVADVTVVVLDLSRPLDHSDRELLEQTSTSARVVACNKIDLPAVWNPAREGIEQAVAVSATTRQGIAELRAAIVRALGGGEPLHESPALTNVRHIGLLREARAALSRAREAARGSAPEEFVAQDVAEARALVEEVTGKKTTDDLLASIFSSFCIGK